LLIQGVDMTNKSPTPVRSVSRVSKGKTLALMLSGGIVLAGTGAGIANATSKTKPKPKRRPVTTAKKTSVTSTKAATAPTAATTSIAVTTTVAGTTAAPGSIVNVWSGAEVDPTKLPIGDDFVTTSGPGIGKLFACRAGNPNAPGASADGPWINASAKTWDSTTKLAVKGEISWPTAKYTEAVSGGNRVLTSNNLPVNMKSGTFPIASDDPSYAYDRNPGKITSTDTVFTLVETGTVASKATCMNEGAVGMMKNGVTIFNALDGRNQDAVAHESQDLCQGHPAMTTYHYHNVPSCLRNAATGSSVVVGWMADGFPMVVERDASGALPTNADLDECHGRTSPILGGKVVTLYHYSATLEFPYSIGCYKGTAKSLK
jgi:YHYH protein